MLRGGTVALALACAVAPCLAQATGALWPALSTAEPGETVVIEVRVDVTATGEELGSYGAALSWDPNVLQYSGWMAGPPPFDTPVINDASAAMGLLRAADADPTGLPGEVILFSVAFQVVGQPCGGSSVTLTLTSLHAAATLASLLPPASIQDAMVSVDDFNYALRAADPNATILAWNPLPGASGYDVIRLSPGGLHQDPNTVHLGFVTCWEDDSADATTAAGTEPANPDTDPLGPGEAFFYLVRARLGLSNLTYGFTSACARERLPDAGDCP